MNKMGMIPPTWSQFLQPLWTSQQSNGAGVTSCGAKLLSLLQVIKQSRETCCEARKKISSVFCINLCHCKIRSCLCD